MDALQIDQDDAVYHNCCYATTVGIEAGMLVSAGYGICRGVYGLYKGSRSIAAVETLSVEAASVESRALTCLSESACAENSFIAEQIANGHAFEKHILTQGEFPGWIRTRNQFAARIEEALTNFTEIKNLKNGRVGYWHGDTGTVVLYDPKRWDKGTCFQPVKGYQYHKEELR